MATPNKKRIGDLLIDKGIITKQQFLEALSKQRKLNMKLGETLISLGYVEERDILKILNEQLKIPVINLAETEFDKEAVSNISYQIAAKYVAIPVYFEGEALVVAMYDPLNIYAIDDIRLISGLEVIPRLATISEIKNAIEIHYGYNEAIQAAEDYKKEQGIEIEEIEEINIENMINDAPIFKFVNNIVEQAIRRKASDIHIEPEEKFIRIRYRIDGALQEVMRNDIRLTLAITARVKIISGMDISEKRKPQDGRITWKLERKEYDLRVSSLPTVNGEKIVIRIANKETLLQNKEKLGFFPDDMEKFSEIIKNPFGIILITGPTGSGKSTTMYGTVLELNKEDVNIVTVEDPVEAKIDGINQVQVNVKAGLTFANTLRSILRQDPNIIIIGEIRDSETAEIAVRAAITGHLVISTIHTNTAAESITRLLDMGIPNYLISSSLVGAIAQRLVRKICPYCKEEYTLSKDEREIMKSASGLELEKAFRGKGCNMCSNQGYSGRTGVYEILPITDDIKNGIYKLASASEIEKIAIQSGMNNLSKRCSRQVIKMWKNWLGCHFHSTGKRRKNKWIFYQSWSLLCKMKHQTFTLQ